MLFMFNGDFDLNNGEDIKISVQNLETSEEIKIFSTPVGTLDRPPATVEDYKFKASTLHPNYIIIKQADDIRLDGSFYIRLQRNVSKDKPIKNGIKFRINVMTGKREFRLRNGESQQAFILPKEGKIGTFFVYYQLNPKSDIHINLNRLNGDKIKMFVGVGVEYPSAVGPKI